MPDLCGLWRSHSRVFHQLLRLDIRMRLPFLVGRRRCGLQYSYGGCEALSMVHRRWKGILYGRLLDPGRSGRCQFRAGETRLAVPVAGRGRNVSARRRAGRLDLRLDFSLLELTQPRDSSRFPWRYSLGDRAKEFTADKKLPPHFTMLLDPGYQFTNPYGVRWNSGKETAYPSTFLIDRQGMVFFSKVSDSYGGRTSAAEMIALVKQKASAK